MRHTMHIHTVAYHATKEMYELQRAIGDEPFDKIIERARELIRLADIIDVNNARHTNTNS